MTKVAAFSGLGLAINLYSDRVAQLYIADYLNELDTDLGEYRSPIVRKG